MFDHPLFDVLVTSFWAWLAYPLLPSSGLGRDSARPLPVELR